MSQKRMISLQITDTDAFLDMPATSQLLYFHLTIRADDEGFVSNPKKISRLIGLQNDDLKVLIAKRFVLEFESGVVVIKHWLIHNNIRMDRFNKTVYQDEKNSLILKENKAYTELINTRQPDGNQKTTLVKLNKVKLGNTIINKTINNNNRINRLSSFNSFWLEYPKKVGKKMAFLAWEKIDIVSFDKIISALEIVKNSKQWNENDGQFIPHASTWLNQERWNDDLKSKPKIIVR